VNDGVWLALMQISHAPEHREVAGTRKKIIRTDAHFKMEAYRFPDEKVLTRVSIFNYSLRS
jgi:hypothetical protein